jgi:hypothetical protein
MPRAPATLGGERRRKKRKLGEAPAVARCRNSGWSRRKRMRMFEVCDGDRRAIDTAIDATACHRIRADTALFFAIETGSHTGKRLKAPEKPRNNSCSFAFCVQSSRLISRSMLKVLQTTKKRIQLTGKIPVLESPVPVQSGGAFRFLTFYGGE